MAENTTARLSERDKVEYHELLPVLEVRRDVVALICEGRSKAQVIAAVSAKYGITRPYVRAWLAYTGLGVGGYAIKLLNGD